MKNRRLLFSLFFIIHFLLFSCNVFFNSGITFDESTFEEEYQLWKENNFTDYSFIYDNNCFDSRPFHIMFNVSVNNGIGVSTPANEDSSHAEKIESMEDVFDYIKNLVIEKEKMSRIGMKKHYYFDITYDELYHFPQKVKIEVDIKNAKKSMDVYSENIQITDFTLTNTQ